MLKNILKLILDGRYNGSIHQLSILLTLPLTISYFGWWSLPVVFVLALIYHAVGIALIGHAMLGHGKTIHPVIDNILYTLFYFLTFVSPALWGGFHMQHHKHPDTEKDPQSAVHYGFKTMLLLFWNNNLVDVRTFLRLKKRYMINLIENHPWLVAMLPVSLFAVVPWNYILLFWLVPASMCVSLATYSAWHTHRLGSAVKKVHPINQILMLGESARHEAHHDQWSQTGFMWIFK